jgi:hypothetical protein
VQVTRQRRDARKIARSLFFMADADGSGFLDKQVGRLWGLFLCGGIYIQRGCDAKLRRELI